MKKILNSIILCIRFPFLYPRNRFTGKHYNNWKIQKQITDITSKYLKFWLREKPDKKLYYVRLFSEYGGHGWTNWWAPIVIGSLKGVHNILELFHCIPTYTELDAMETGWRKRFGIQMCKDIRNQLIRDYFEYNFLKGFKKTFKFLLFDFRIMQLKEKYGELRLYTNWATPKVFDIIEYYSGKSQHICFNCGKDADIVTSINSYMLPYCKECFGDSMKEIEEYRDITGEWHTCDNDSF